MRQLPFRRLFTRLNRPVPDGAGIVTAYTDGQVTLRSNRSKIGYHEAADLSGFQGVEVGDFVVHGLDIMRGSVGVAESSGAISSVCTVCKPTGQIDPRYAAYAVRLQAASGFPKALARGVREGGADFRRWDTLAELPIPAPPLDVQRAVVAFLARETDEIDAFIADQEELVELLAERRAATISHAVTKGLAPTVPMRDSGIAWLGQIPAHWVPLALKRVLRSVDQGISPQAEGGLADAESVGVLRAGCVNRGIFNELEHKRLPDGFAFDDSIRVKVGDLIVNRASGSPSLVGSAARVRALRYELILSDKTFRLRTLPSADLDFLELFLNSNPYRRQVLGAISGAEGLANNLPLAALKEISLALPPVDEQTRIVEAISKGLAQIDSAIADAREAIKLSRERRAALISAAVTGKIDVRGVV